MNVSKGQHWARGQTFSLSTETQSPPFFGFFFSAVRWNDIRCAVVGASPCKQHFNQVSARLSVHQSISPPPQSINFCPLTSGWMQQLSPWLPGNHILHPVLLLQLRAVRRDTLSVSGVWLPQAYATVHFYTFQQTWCLNTNNKCARYLQVDLNQLIFPLFHCRSMCRVYFLHQLQSLRLMNIYLIKSGSVVSRGNCGGYCCN